MARARPWLLLLALGAGLAAAWWLGAGGERDLEVPGARRPAADLEEGAVARGGPVLEADVRPVPPPLVPGPVIAPAAGPPSEAPSASGVAEIAGWVIDEQGRAAPAGRLQVAASADVYADLQVLAEVDVVAGRFVVRLPPGRAGDMLLSYASSDHGAWAFRRVSVPAARRLDGVELLLVPSVRVEVTVLGPAGAPAPDAVVDVELGGARAPARVALDPRGRGSVRVPRWGGVGWVRASSPDGRFFEHARLLLSGEVVSCTLRLTGPWERAAVRVTSERQQPAEPATAWVLVGGRRPVPAPVDGEAVHVWLPPAGQEFKVRAFSWDLSDHIEEALDDATRARVVQQGLTLTLGPRPRSPLPLQIVDDAGEPMRWVTLCATQPGREHPEWCQTDEHGRAVLHGLHVGDDVAMSHRAALPELARFRVPDDDLPVRITLPGPSSRASGAVRGDWDATFPPQVEVEAETSRGWAHVDVANRRWHATLLVPEGTPVGVRVASATVVQPTVHGRTGQQDIDVEARFARLEIAPRLGAVVRPRGHLVLEPASPAPDAPPRRTSQEVDPGHEPCARFVGLEPGPWRVGFQPAGQRVRWHPVPLEVGEGARRVELDFGPP